jgi:O-antigen ligase
LVHDRVSSLFGNELILGSYLSRNYPLFFCLFLFFLEKNKLSKKITIISYIVIIFIPVLVFMSGERSSVFYFFLAAIYILLFYPKKNIFFIFLFSIFLIGIGTISLDKRFSERIFKQTKIQLTYESEKHKRLNLFSITHEEHYKSAFRIFKDNVLFGAGPKSFRLKCSEEKYIISKTSCTTHPHNTYMQLLSETGIIGFLFVFSVFIILCINSVKMIYNKYFLDGHINSDKVCLYASFLITLWPIIPSGNFFNNWLAVVYYLPVGFFMWVFQKKNPRKINIFTN